MRNSGIGGQAVIEGVMMRNKDKYAVAVRKENNDIVVETREYHSFADKHKIAKVPIIRGVVAFVESMVVGINTLMLSASYQEDEEDIDRPDDKGNNKKEKDSNKTKAGSTAKSESADKAKGTDKDKKNINNSSPYGRNKDGKNADSKKADSKKADNKNADSKKADNKNADSKKADSKKADSKNEDSEKADSKSDNDKKNGLKEGLDVGLTVVIAIIAAVGIFMILPYYASRLLSGLISSDVVLALIEGVIRMIIFVLYVFLISQMEDIKRVFMYHGAEHKSINCIENGLPLTVENAKKQSREHKRCGTSFLLYVMIISIIFFVFIRVESQILRVVFRLLLVPVIAGVAYEFIKLAGRSNSKVMAVLSRPGFWLQGLTTREPSDDMLEVAICSVNAVFDWKAFLAEEGIEQKDGESEACLDKKDEKGKKVKKGKSTESKSTESKNAKNKNAENRNIESKNAKSKNAEEKAFARKADENSNAKTKADLGKISAKVNEGIKEAAEKISADAGPANEAAKETSKETASAQEDTAKEAAKGTAPVHGDKAKEASKETVQAQYDTAKEAAKETAPVQEDTANEAVYKTKVLKTGTRGHGRKKSHSFFEELNQTYFYEENNKPEKRLNEEEFEGEEDDEILSKLDRYFEEREQNV